MKKEYRGPWRKVELWVKPADERKFLARTMTNLWLIELNRAVKDLEKYLESRWPAGYEIKVRRTR